ncbi:DNA topoisomerase IV [Maribacter algicola]|uniref:DNA topoisomerase IV n=1 Tax=Meishania litoralis TaxID=3434685 RepID=A0ACC7LL30_9FLAO
MKKSLWLLVVMGTMLASCHQPERYCEAYRNGVFSFDYIADGIAKTGKFTRQGDLSIEYYDGKIDSSSVRWINDCEYVVKKINPKNKSEERSIHMKILSTTENSYTFEYNIVGDSNKSRGTAIKTN